MSVIVKGMEMPTKCCECDAEYCEENFHGDEFDRVCSFIYNGYTEKIRDSGRRDDCPLRPLPEEHGRLGDLDEIKNKLAKDKREAFTKHDVWLMISRYGAETIVEAEGE